MKRRILEFVLFIATASGAWAQVVHAPSFPFTGDSAGDFFGVSVSAAGDVNNDGFDDFIVGAFHDDNDAENSGSATVFSGATGAVLYIFEGGADDEHFGISVSGAGDVNADGYDDVIVGARTDNANGIGSGSARVFSGADGSVLFTFLGYSPSDSFGGSVSGAGDVDGDGHDDVIVGAYLDATGGLGSGSSRVFSGLDGALLYTFNGDSIGDIMGASVSGAGDVNNDGFDDVIVGARHDDNNGEDSGSARVFSGVDGTILYTFNGDSEFGSFGVSVSGAGDVNGDGYADLIVGANVDDTNGEDAGMARVHSGADGSILFTFYGETPGGWFGSEVSGAGDVNGDGFDDLIVGAHLDDVGGVESGSVRVFSGADGSVLYTFRGQSPGIRLGNSVSDAGDLNNDGFADFIVGAWLDDANGMYSGSVFVFRSVAVLAPCPGDATGDHDVDFDDLNAVLSNFGAPCPD